MEGDGNPGDYLWGNHEGNHEGSVEVSVGYRMIGLGRSPWRRAVVSGGLRGVEPVAGGGFSRRGLGHVGRPSMPGQRLPRGSEDGRVRADRKRGVVGGKG